MTVVQHGQGRVLNPDMTLKVGTQDLPHGSLSVVKGIVAPGQYIGPHTHSREDEVTLVLEGQIVALLDDTVLEPAGVMHAFGNRGPAPARVYESHAPGACVVSEGASSRRLLGAIHDVLSVCGVATATGDVPTSGECGAMACGVILKAVHGVLRHCKAAGAHRGARAGPRHVL